MPGISCGPYEIEPHGTQWAIKAGPITLLVVDGREEAIALADRAQLALRPVESVVIDRVPPEPKSFAAQDYAPWPDDGERPEAETADEEPRPIPS